jgi:hypothetical protein
MPALRFVGALLLLGSLSGVARADFTKTIHAVPCVQVDAEAGPKSVCEELDLCSVRPGRLLDGQRARYSRLVVAFGEWD